MKNTTGKRLYVTADRARLVDEGSAEAAFLLAAVDDEVSDEDAARYGLKAADPVADKAVDKPADKAGAARRAK